MLACAANSPQPTAAAGEHTPPPPSQIADDTPCSVVANDKCYASSDEACKAIGCPPARCQFSYSDPMEASCS